MRNCTLTGSQLFQDILSYSLPLIGCSETCSDADVGAATGGLSLHLTAVGPWRVDQLCSCFVEMYMKKLFGSNKDRMGVDQKAVLLVSKVNESKRHGR